MVIYTKITKTECPACGQVLRGFVDVKNYNSMIDGNTCVCFHCRAFLLIYDGLKLRVLTDVEVAELDHDDKMRLVRTRKKIEDFLAMEKDIKKRFKKRRKKTVIILTKDD